jgi:hypothetical protein
VQRHGRDQNQQDEHRNQRDQVQVGQRPGFLDPAERTQPHQPVQPRVRVGRHAKGVRDAENNACHGGGAPACCLTGQEQVVTPGFLVAAQEAG